MNAYKITIRKSVKHNGIFSHNVSRELIAHAKNEDEAKNKITLEKSYQELVTGNLTVDVGDEAIYSFDKIGTVHKETKEYFVYSNENYPPIETNKFKHGILQR
jgi:hypothetical protein